MPLALPAPALGAFGIGTTEFIIAGLLSELAADFGTSIPTAGLLVSGYAFGVVVGAPVMTALGWAPFLAVVTYVAPLLTDVTGFSKGAVPLVITLLGLGMLIGGPIAAASPTVL
ncbi:hypothetical protein ACGFNU_31065 [Spirillospora sp. NPDC048911]|uniref:hypothetical protein n=1 Tax=Spirillospora sp. NPDC048911 TaxID=3364527 RepID=UPI00371AC817